MEQDQEVAIEATSVTQKFLNPIIVRIPLLQLTNRQETQPRYLHLQVTQLRALYTSDRQVISRRKITDLSSI